MIIHIVDDEESILDAMSFLLAPLGVEIQTWQNHSTDGLYWRTGRKGRGLF